MVQQQPAALIGMLRRQSSESGVLAAAGPHGQMPGMVQGAQGVAQLLHQPPLVPTVSQQQQQVNLNRCFDGRVDCVIKLK